MFQTFSQADAPAQQSHSRLATCPPAARSPGRKIQGAHWREHLGRWLDSAWPGLLGATRPADSSQVIQGVVPLARVRADFVASLIDIDTRAARAAQDRIALAASLHDLWHLRADVFDLVSRHHDQAQAECRLLLLNRHFPSRASMRTPARRRS